MTLKSRWVSVCLIAAASVFMITAFGCRGGGGFSDSNVVTLSFGLNVETRHIYEEVKKEFEALNPDIKIKEMPIEGKEYYKKLQTMIAGNEAPDIMWMGMGFGEFAMRGVFMPLNNFLAADSSVDLEGINPAILEMYKTNGMIYGLPYGIDYMMFAYNMDIFDKAGMPYPDESWTIKDMVKAAKVLTVRRGKQAEQYGFAGSITLSMFGLTLLSEDLSRCTMDTPEAIEYIKFHVDLIHKYRIVPNISVAQMSSTEDLFMTGRLAMAALPTWSIVNLSKKVDNFKWGITLLPTVNGHRGHWASSSGFCMYKNAKNKEAAWRVLKHYTSAKSLMVKSFPNTIPVRSDVLEGCLKKYSGNPIGIKALKDALPYLIPDPRVPQINRLMDIVYKNMEAAELRVVTPEQAARDITKECNNVLKQDR